MKLFINKSYIVFFCLFCFIGIMCKKESTEKEIELSIASSFSTCNPSFTSIKSDFCIRVTPIGGSASYYMDKDAIRGFTFESGYEYRVLVKSIKITNPPADGNSSYYQLVKIISKEVK